MIDYPCVCQAQSVPKLETSNEVRIMTTDKQPQGQQTSRRFHALRELAEVTTKDYRTIHRAARAGKIRTVRFGGSVLIPHDEFERVLKYGWR